jgi:hypothetical protein
MFDEKERTITRLVDRDTPASAASPTRQICGLPPALLCTHSDAKLSAPTVRPTSPSPSIAPSLGTVQISSAVI